MNNGLGMMFSGIRVFESSLCMVDSDVPNKKHNWTGRKKSTGQYHWRIQKKWTKRWGFVKKPGMYQTPDGFICHPSIAQRLKQELSGYQQ